ncbi:ornithine cyclodeaminase [Oceanicola granulosus HTCC2516]|uniref:Ornithine cyclodeaminase n=1 Tax=Oceanicola granulosus (strain ATCC BAA-861 / DSM 15982 / KCTC 12143 / HTCC2516) TaxID=314256 RepID=Q2CF72_OCEGH|nr:ornithine cyclodeaminase [Oceanicola granulosus]EAR51255.1 ornithine cyclodeaminase [Oceanicola granulosus HTCC2516]
MKLFSAEEVHRLLDYPYLIEALRRAHLSEHPYGDHLLADDPAGSGNQFVSLLGWKAESAIAAKLVGVFPGNRDLDPPQASVQGIVAGFDPDTGAPRFVADGEAMTFRKTAAVSGLGAALLARRDSEVLLVVGAGGLAPHVLAAHCAARPSIRRVLVWNRTAERARRLAGGTELENVTVTATEDLDAATSEADVISCVTMSTTPLVRGDLLKPGCHLDLVGAYRPDMREADDRAMSRGTLFVDTRNGMEGAGDLAQPVGNGLLDWSDIRADFYELVQGGHPGRSDQDEVTVCKNVGGGHLDLFTAEALMARCDG